MAKAESGQLEPVLDSVIRFMVHSHPAFLNAVIDTDTLTTTPGTPCNDAKKLCQKLIKEELHKELLPALEADDLVEIVDGIADSIFVLLFTAICYGLPIVEIWDEVVRKNMEKVVDGKIIRDPETQKILKPTGWKPPDIAGILERAGWKP